MAVCSLSVYSYPKCRGSHPLGAAPMELPGLRRHGTNASAQCYLSALPCGNELCVLARPMVLLPIPPRHGPCWRDRHHGKIVLCQQHMGDAG